MIIYWRNMSVITCISSAFSCKLAITTPWSLVLCYFLLSQDFWKKQFKMSCTEYGRLCLSMYSSIVALMAFTSIISKPLFYIIYTLCTCVSVASACPLNYIIYIVNLHQGDDRLLDNVYFKHGPSFRHVVFICLCWLSFFSISILMLIDICTCYSWFSVGCHA